jgi:hypothetical protein
MSFTHEAIAQNPNLIAPSQDRAWEVWDEPDPVRPGTVAALRLIFVTSELGVLPDQRLSQRWRDTSFVDTHPRAGKLTVATLFLTQGEIKQSHESEPTLHLASLPLPSRRRVQVTVHAKDENTFPQFLATNRTAALAQVSAQGVRIPEQGYLYFFGHQDDGARFIAGVRAKST